MNCLFPPYTIIARKQNPHPWRSQENLSDSRKIWKRPERHETCMRQKSQNCTRSSLLIKPWVILVTSVRPTQVASSSGTEWPKHQAHAGCEASEQGALGQRRRAQGNCWCLLPQNYWSNSVLVPSETLVTYIKCSSLMGTPKYQPKNPGMDLVS